MKNSIRQRLILPLFKMKRYINNVAGWHMLNIHNPISPRYGNSRDFFEKTRCTHSRQCLRCLYQNFEPLVAHLDSHSIFIYTFLDDAFWRSYLFGDRIAPQIGFPDNLRRFTVQVPPLKRKIVILHILVNNFFQVLPEPARQFYKRWLRYSPKPPSYTSYSVVYLGF